MNTLIENKGYKIEIKDNKMKKINSSIKLFLILLFKRIRNIFTKFHQQIIFAGLFFSRIHFYSNLKVSNTVLHIKTPK